MRSGHAPAARPEPASGWRRSRSRVRGVRAHPTRCERRRSPPSPRWRHRRAVRQQQLASAFAKLPVSFIENRGQTDARVRYYAQGNRFGFFMTPSEVMMSFAKRHAASTTQTADQLALALRFVGHNPQVEPQGVCPRRRGQRPARQRSEPVADADPAVPRRRLPRPVAGHRPAAARAVGRAEVRVPRAPGRLAVRHPARLRRRRRPRARARPAGCRSRPPLGVLQDSAPVSYQDDRRRPHVRWPAATCSAAVPTTRFSFGVGGYQRDHELVIDPGVQYTTFLGGNAHETGAGIAVDAAGNAFIAGTTQSPDFPTTAGAFRPHRRGTELRRRLRHQAQRGRHRARLLDLRRRQRHGLRQLAWRSTPPATPTSPGTTKSSNFPTTDGAFDRTLEHPAELPALRASTTPTASSFKLNAAGSALVYSTYLGGTDIDSPRGIAVDGSRQRVRDRRDASRATSRRRRARSAARARGEYDMFVTKLNPTGSALVYSTFLGGTAGRQRRARRGRRRRQRLRARLLELDRLPDHAPARSTPPRTARFDATLTKLNPAGSALVYSTFLGGSDFDGGRRPRRSTPPATRTSRGGTRRPDLADDAGRVRHDVNNNGDAFVTKFNPAGSALVYSTFVGGSDFDSLGGIVLDPAGNAWLTGSTSSADFPVTAGAPDTTFNGGARRDHRRAERDRDGAARSRRSSAARTRRAAPTSPAIRTATSTSPARPSRRTSRPRSAPSTRSGTATSQIFWGDAFVTKLDIDARRSTPPAPPGVPAAPTLVSPANASSQPQPITFDWNDVAEAVSYTIQIDDSSAFSAPLVRDQTVTVVDLRDDRSVDRRPTSGASAASTRPGRRPVLGGAQLHAAGTLRRRRSWRRSTSTRPRSTAATRPAAPS